MRKTLLAILLLAVAFAAPTYGATLAESAYHTLNNGTIQLKFQRRGDGLALTSIQRLPDGTVISLEPFSADWRINLKTRDHPAAELALALSTLREVKPTGIDGKMAAGADWFEAHWSKQEDRAVEVSPHTHGTISLKEITGDNAHLVASWEGNGTIFDESCRFEVTARWSLAPGDFAARTSIEVKLLPAEGQERTPIYLSSVDYPIYRIQRIGKDNHLVCPFIGGHLYHHPTENKMYARGNEPGVLWSPVYAYFDEQTGNCLYMANTDVTGNYKLIETATLDGYLFQRVRQIPPDVFESRHYVQPYGDIVGVLEGDWVTAAEAYREFLAENADWYKGPVGSPANTMPQRLKDCMVVSTQQFGRRPSALDDAKREQYKEQLSLPGVRDPWEETEDALGKDVQLTSEALNNHVLSIWYYPGYEGALGRKDPDTERRRSVYCDDLSEEAQRLASAVAIAQQNPDNMVAPYVNGKENYLFLLNPLDKGPYTPRNFGALASALIAENGRIAVKRHDHITHACPAAPWWRDHLPQVVYGHFKRWGIRAVYLDYLKGFHTCYSEYHDHKPGGGDFIIQGKIEQMRRIRELLAKDGMTDFAIGMEGASGPYTAEVNLGNRHIFSNWGLIRESEAVPLHEMIYNNVKYHRISAKGGRTSAEHTGLWSWFLTTEVFPFGHIVSVGNGLTNYQEIFGVAEGKPYYDFAVKLVAFLTSDGFKKYHNGSLARQLDGEVIPEGNFHVQVDDILRARVTDEEIYYDKSSDGNFIYAKPYLLSVMPRGVFKSPDGDMAFVICNPWVGPNPFSEQDTFGYNFTFDPDRYKGFPSRYKLTKVASDGTKTVLGKRTWASRLKGELGPGEIEYWTMERTSGG